MLQRILHTVLRLQQEVRYDCIVTHLPDGVVETAYFGLAADACKHEADDRQQSIVFYPCEHDIFYPALMCEGCGHCRTLIAVPGIANTLQAVDCDATCVVEQIPGGGN